MPNPAGPVSAIPAVGAWLERVAAAPGYLGMKD
jgi:hypothetical protein